MELIRSNKVNIQSFYSHKLSPEKDADTCIGLQDKPKEYIGVVFHWKAI